MRFHLYQFSDKTGNFDFLGQNLLKNAFWCHNFKNISLDLESASLRYFVHQFSNKMDNFEYLGPNLPKTGFWGQNSKYLNLDLESASIFRQSKQIWIFGSKFAQKWILGSEFQKSNSGFGINSSTISCVSIFSQNGHLVFRPKFGEIPQLCAIFWFKYCWGCCRELGGGRWRWVAQFSNTLWWHI